LSNVHKIPELNNTSASNIVTSSNDAYNSNDQIVSTIRIVAIQDKLDKLIEDQKKI
jgi:hypothetical protein